MGGGEGQSVACEGTPQKEAFGDEVVPSKQQFWSSIVHGGKGGGTREPSLFR